MGKRFANISIAVPVACLIGWQTFGASIAYAQDLSIVPSAGEPDNTTDQITGAPGCDPNVTLALSSAATYGSQMQYNTAYTIIQQPTSFFGCLNGLFNDANSLINAFSGTGSGNLLSVLQQLAASMLGSLMNELQQQVCGAVSSVMGSIPGGGYVSAIMPSGGVTQTTSTDSNGVTTTSATGGGPVPGVTTTSLLGHSHAPIVNNYKQPDPNNVQISNVPQVTFAGQTGPDDGDLDFMLETGGGSALRANTPMPAPGTGNGSPGSGSPTPVTGPIPAGEPTEAHQSDDGPSFAVDYVYPRPAGGGKGKTCIWSGGAAAWRANNAGNAAYGPTTKAMGAIGSLKAKGITPFAVFPDKQRGELTITSVLNHYMGDSIHDTMYAYAPPKENKTEAYISFLVGRINSATGAATVTPSTMMSTLSPSQLEAMVQGIEIKEGQTAGKIVCDPS